MLGVTVTPESTKGRARTATSDFIRWIRYNISKMSMDAMHARPIVVSLLVGRVTIAPVKDGGAPMDHAR